MSLCVTDTRGSHSELTGEFAAIRQEMEQIAAFLGKKVLGQVTESAFWAALPALRKACGDRAVLRAIHYFEENARTLAQRDALQAGSLMPLQRWCWKADAHPLRYARMSTAAPMCGIRGFRWHWR